VLVAAANGIFLLAILACPISMGLMMVFMGRGMMGGKKRGNAGAQEKGESVENLKAEQARLAERIATLDSDAGESSETAPATTDEPPLVHAEATTPERTPTAAAR